MDNGIMEAARNAYTSGQQSRDKPDFADTYKLATDTLEDEIEVQHSQRAIPNIQVRRETKPIDITIVGKTIVVIFSIIDIGNNKDIILGLLQYKDYNLDISQKNSSYL